MPRVRMCYFYVCVLWIIVPCDQNVRYVSSFSDRITNTNDTFKYFIRFHMNDELALNVLLINYISHVKYNAMHFEIIIRCF